MVKCIAFAGRFVGIAAGNPLLRAIARPAKLCWGRKLGIAEREGEKRTKETIVSFPFPPRHGRAIPPAAAAASHPNTEPNRIAAGPSMATG